VLRGAVEVLHMKGQGQVGLQGVEDVFAGELFEGGARRVEVPVVVVEEGARVLGAAFGGVLVEVAVAGG
jgi:hypothetical protein